MNVQYYKSLALFGDGLRSSMYNLTTVADPLRSPMCINTTILENGIVTSHQTTHTPAKTCKRRSFSMRRNFPSHLDRLYIGSPSYEKLGAIRRFSRALGSYMGRECEMGKK